MDTHCHLDKLKATPAESLAQAKAAGIGRVITIGTEPADLPIVLRLSQEFPGQVYCTLGIHPHEGAVWSAESAAFIRQNASEPGVVALGEMGLDYYYKHSPVDSQKAAFRDQLALAAELGLPVEIHTRDAEEDTIAILQEFRGQVRGLIHCFTGTQWLADQALDLGFNISVSGVVTFKNAESLRETVRQVPLNRLHVETDAPFLAPIPHRGQENVPAFVVHTAKLVANLKGVSEAELAQQLRLNTLDLFPKIQWPQEP